MARVAGTALAPVAPEEIEYPSSDGERVAESSFQLIPLFYAFDALRRRYAARDDVFVAAVLLLYYQEGNPAARVAPDVFVVLGAENRPRHTYQLWKEPKGPDFVLEITSASTRDRDQGPKRETYRQLGVREYFQYDPTRDYLDPPLQGLELIGRRYERRTPEELADGTLRLESKVLALELREEAGRLRFYDPAPQGYLLSSKELEQQRKRAEQQRKQAEERRDRAEELLKRAKQRRKEAEERLQLEVAARRQAEARLHEAVARRQAEALLHDEAAARRQAEARVAALEALLRERGENGTPSR